MAQYVQQVLQEHRLSGASLSRKQRQPLSRLDGKQQLGKERLVGRGGEEKATIRRHVKGVPLQPKKGKNAVRKAVVVTRLPVGGSKARILM